MRFESPVSLTVLVIWVLGGSCSHIGALSEWSSVASFSLGDKSYVTRAS